MSTPATPHSKSVQSNSPKKSEQDDLEFLSIGHSQFNITNLTALYSSTFATGFSNNKCQAAAHALLRHNAHLDGAHFQSRIKGGLHPAYIGFNLNMNDKKKRALSNSELAEASLQDIFDPVMMQDHLDGGITLLLHLTIDLYVTPQELCKTPEHIDGDIAVLIQAFCQDLEVITPPENSAQPSSISVDGPQHLPFPLSPTSSCIQCLAQNPHLFKVPANANTDGTPSAAIHKAKELVNTSNGPPSTPQKSQAIKQMPSTAKLLAHSMPPFLTNPTILGPALISIGPSTDTVLNCFKMSDKWNLTYKQAINLSQALIVDTQGSVGTKLKVLPGGKGALPALVQQASEEYKSLSVEEKKALIEEYTPYKGHKTFTIKDEHHTGTETMLYMTCGSITLLLHGVAFATEGIKNFMGMVMHIDDHDLVSKMEGFTVQGVKGAAANYQQCISQWAHYFHNIIACYLVTIEGWPNCIPFTNLSTVSSALLDLEILLRMWESGSIFWKQLSEEEYEALHLKHDAKLNSGELIEHTHRTCSDKGIKQAQQNNATRNSQHAFKSAESVPTDTEDEDNDSRSTHTPATMATTPATTSTTLATTAGPAPCSAAKQTSCSYYPNPPQPFAFLTLTLTFTMWAQHGDGGDGTDGFGFDFGDSMSFDN
ncbi:hypothetical protein V8B97DRAFT_2023740 [Scleroderma yunnanense]